MYYGVRCFDTQFEFQKDFSVAFFFFNIDIDLVSWMDEILYFNKGKIVYKLVLECLPKIKCLSGTASME